MNSQARSSTNCKQNQYMNPPLTSRRWLIEKLKQDAIPSLNPMPKCPQVASYSENSSGKISSKKEHEQLIHGAMLQAHEDYEERGQQTEDVPHTQSDFREMHFKLLEEKELIQSQLHDITEQHNVALQELSASRMSEKDAYYALQKLFTENEITILTKKKKIVRWTDEEVGNAFTLRYQYSCNKNE